MSGDKKRSVFKVMGVVLLYWTVSISLVFVMKHLLSGHYGNQDLSIFISWYQSCVTVAVIFGVGFFGRLFRFGIEVPRLDAETIFNPDMLALSLTFIGSLTLNNLMLKHIGISFYQIARSFTLIFTIGMTSCMLRQIVSLKVTFSCLLIVCGFFIGIDQEEASGSITAWGCIYGLLASFTCALCGIYFKKGEAACGGSSLKLAYVNNFNSMVMFFPLVISTNQLSHLYNSEFFSDPSLWMFLTFSGVMSLLIGWISALQIRYTSPMTHHISINTKSLTQTLIAIVVNNEHKTFMWWVGNLFVISGILTYSYLKYKEQNSSRVVKMPSASEEPMNVYRQNGFKVGPDDELSFRPSVQK
ncbi:GDP-fucose transporter 1-like [Gigantopelta aegis]|uniref:GDP-fucose transporter 1-like n=1 Tax=Gigantopelta aegis TaxID=1735272 RepID=UPI001B88B399|nr:GDP-fucose transporter 1-like [Gigantopelta aegis]